MNPVVPKIVIGRLAAFQTGGEESHPDADVLTAFLERALPERQVNSVVSHLATCNDCREIIALAQPEVVLQAPAAVAIPARRSPFIWRWAAVAAGGAIALAVMLHSREGRVVEQQLAAATGVGRLNGKPMPGVQNESAAVPGSPPAMGNSLTPRRMPPLQVEPGAPESSVGEVSANPVPLADAPASRESAGRSSSGSSAPGLADQLAANGGAPKRADAVREEAKAKSDKVFEKDGALETRGSLAEVGQGAGVASSKPVPVAPTQKSEYRASSSPMENVSALPLARQAAAWQVTDDGSLQRSFDGGKNWESVSLNQAVRMRVVVSRGFHVWAGGNAGMLFRSDNGGNQFSAVHVAQNQAALAGDIVALTFADADHGRLETSIHEVWTTADGGVTWSSASTKP